MRRESLAAKSDRLGDALHRLRLAVALAEVAAASEPEEAAYVLLSATLACEATLRRLAHPLL